MTIDRETLSFHFERLLDASEAEAFDAWTTPDQLAAWWDPTGAPLAACEIDLRVGGAFTLQNAGHAPPFRGVYTVLERPTTLAFEAMGTVGTVRFVAERHQTRMTVVIKSPSREHFETFTRLGIYEGTQRTFDNLVARFSSKKR
jgi:uncharacterized protein YndB with AHSA1/START domain